MCGLSDTTIKQSDVTKRHVIRKVLSIYDPLAS